MNKEQLLKKMDPEVAPLYASLPGYDFDTYEKVCAIRENADIMYASDDFSVRNRQDISLQVLTIPNGAGGNTMEIRVFRPAQSAGTLPCILFFHGGGCVFGKAFHEDIYCADNAVNENCVVVNVDYRCAPEYPAPAGQLDALAAWKWLTGEGAGLLKIDPEKIIVNGNSGGGNIVIGLTLRLLDAQLPLPAAVVTLYPMLDDRGITPSSHIVEDGSIWSRSQNQDAWNYYLHGLDPNDTRVPDGYIAPARRESFTGFPATFTYVGGVEVFRDETIELVSKLSRDGVETEFILCPGCYHGFDRYCPDAGVTRRALAAKHDFIQRVFRR